MLNQEDAPGQTAARWSPGSLNNRNGGQEGSGFRVGKMKQSGRARGQVLKSYLLRKRARGQVLKVTYWVKTNITRPDRTQ